MTLEYSTNTVELRTTGLLVCAKLVCRLLL